jgi:hypothetical protein
MPWLRALIVCVLVVLLSAAVTTALWSTDPDQRADAIRVLALLLSWWR